MVFRKCILDAEMLSAGTFPDPENPEQKVISHALWDSIEDDYRVLLVGDELKKEEMILEMEEEEIGEVNIVLETYPNEYAHLSRLVDYIVSRGIDIILGWNVESFDMSYDLNRMGRLDVPYHRISETYASVYQNRQGYWKVNVKGRHILDLLRVYKKQNVKGLRSHALEYVAQKELGYGKLVHEESIDEMYRNNLNKFIRYNLKDVILCEKLEKKLSLSDEFVTNSKIASSNLSDVFSESQLADSFILSHKDDDIILPTQRESEAMGHFSGGKVYSEGGGLYGVKTND